jgi:hypothetical protein
MNNVVAPWRRFLAHPWCIPALVTIGVLLNSPTLWLGLLADDFIQRYLMIGLAQAPKPGSLFGLFNFADGLPASVQAMKESGRLAWWAGDTFRLTFWRPLSELTHWVDYQLWPNSAFLMHAQNILWLGALTALLAKLYGVLDPGNRLRTALATMLFAFSYLHISAVCWLAARNQLIAGCFIVLTILAFHAWRSQKSPTHGWLAVLAFGLCLASAEAGIAALAYLVAYSLTLERDTSWLQRARSLLPFVLLVVTWRLFYNHYHYGSWDSGAYIDPGTNLPRFSGAMLLRLPTLMMAQVFGVPAGLRNGAPLLQQTSLALLATLAMALFALVGHHFKLWASPQARFYALGAVLAMVPVCAAEPNDRLLLNGEIGTGAVLAILFGLMLERRTPSKGWAASGAKVVVGLMMVVHLVLFPLLTAGASAALAFVVVPTVAQEPMTLPDARGDDLARHVILLNPPKVPMLFYYPYVRNYFGFGSSASMQGLASGTKEITLIVLDDSTIRMSSQGGFMDVLTRDVASKPFKVGDTVDIGQVIVTVNLVSDAGIPQEATFHFKAPLHDQQWRFYAWTDDAYRPFKLPAPGQQVVLPSIELGKLFGKRIKGALGL